MPTFRGSDRSSIASLTASFDVVVVRVAQPVLVLPWTSEELMHDDAFAMAPRPLSLQTNHWNHWTGLGERWYSLIGTERHPRLDTNTKDLITEVEIARIYPGFAYRHSVGDR